MAAAVLDVGKTHTKLSVISSGGAILTVRTYANARVWPALDTAGIEAWLLATLRDLAATFAIEAIIPVGHGAAAAFLKDGQLAAPVRDYEVEPPVALAQTYDAQRDPFAVTLSPRLPAGLNLGMQLWWQEWETPALRNAALCLWPQYWAWRLSGIHAAEVSSLGCHTDVWQPIKGRYSALAGRQGWSERFATVTHAASLLGELRSSIARETGLSPRCEIHCGLHDSNAALNAFAGDAPFTLVSTGTWFVAMRRGGGAPPVLDEGRDTLGNVDIDGRVVPSARFMGGREFEQIAGAAREAAATPAQAAALIARGVRTRPSFVFGCGPFPAARGAILGDLAPGERPTLAELHLALMTDAVLDLIGADGPVVLEGRFAENPVFGPALAALRRGVLRASSADGVAYGAWRLRHPDAARLPLRAYTPLPADIRPYRDRWRAEAEG